MSYVTLHQMSDEQAVNILPFYFTEPVKHWFYQLTENSKTSLTSFKRALFARYRKTEEDLDLDDICSPSQSPRFFSKTDNSMLLKMGMVQKLLSVWCVKHSHTSNCMCTEKCSRKTCILHPLYFLLRKKNQYCVSRSGVNFTVWHYSLHEPCQSLQQNMCRDCKQINNCCQTIFGRIIKH